MLKIPLSKRRTLLNLRGDRESLELSHINTFLKARLQTETIANYNQAKLLDPRRHLRWQTKNLIQ
jgi:hypothetical protein